MKVIWHVFTSSHGVYLCQKYYLTIEVFFYSFTLSSQFSFLGWIINDACNGQTYGQGRNDILKFESIHCVHCCDHGINSILVYLSLDNSSSSKKMPDIKIRLCIFFFFLKASKRQKKNIFLSFFVGFSSVKGLNCSF